MTNKPISPEVLREAERLLPEWEVVRGPMHATDDFRFPVYASKCRPAVARAIQDREDRLAEAEGHIRALMSTIDEFADDPTGGNDASPFRPTAWFEAQDFLNSLGNTMERG